jgi:hypothetical protein
MAIAVGLERPVATGVSAKPEGRVAAARGAAADARRAGRTRGTAREKTGRRREGIAVT